MTVNVPTNVPVCDRVKVFNTTVMLTEFLFKSSDGNISVPAASVVVWFRYVYGNMVFQALSRTSSGTLALQTGDRYYIYST